MWRSGQPAGRLREDVAPEAEERLGHVFICAAARAESAGPVGLVISVDEAGDAMRLTQPIPFNQRPGGR